MNCPKCNNEAIENQALGKNFWYCRTCKDEVDPSAPNQPISIEDNDLPWGVYIAVGSCSPYQHVCAKFTVQYRFAGHIYEDCTECGAVRICTKISGLPLKY